MQFKITFDRSGDEIPFVATNPDLVSYYVEQINQRNLNRFSSMENIIGTKIVGCCQDLKSIITDVNQYLVPMFGREFPDLDTLDYLDQRVLGAIHAAWADNHSLCYDIETHRLCPVNGDRSTEVIDLYPDEIPRPVLSDVLSKLGLLERYRDINLLVHSIETYFNFVRYQIKDMPWFEIKNPFPDNIVSHDICNLNLTFNHLGRTLYNKWAVWDLDLEHQDENTYRQLLGFVDIKLCQPQTGTPSQEYLVWCQKVNRPATGEHLTLGNIPNLYENLTKYRKIILTNLIEQNHFTIQL